MVNLAQEKHEAISIIGVGDIMPGTNFPSDKYLPPDSGKYLLAAISDLLQNADFTIGNLEGCLLDNGPVVKKCKDSTKCYAFRIPTWFGGIFKEAGIDAFNVANNHFGDFGEAGRKSTIQCLDSLDIAFFGTSEYPYAIMKKDSIRVGLTGFSPFNNTLDMFDTIQVKSIISSLKSNCNIVVVSLHAGAEGATYNRITRQGEIFLEEDRGNPYNFSHIAIDAGADIVFCHGPHITRAIELYKNRLIAYSLGNFCTYARFNLKGPNGVAPIIKVFTSPRGEFLHANIFSIIQQGEGGPTIDSQQSALKQIIELTQLDFGDTPLTISPSGEVTKK